MYKDIEALIEDYNYLSVVTLAEFSATSEDGRLSFYDEIKLWGLKNKNGNIVGYALEHYHTGLNPGGFGVMEVYPITDLSVWNGIKQFYKNRGIK